MRRRPSTPTSTAPCCCRRRPLSIPRTAAIQIVAATQVSGGPPTVGWRTTSGGGTWTPLSGLEPAGAASSRGAPDIVWGVGNDVWIAHLGADTGDGCDTGSGIFLSRSTNDGASFSTPSSPYAANQPAPLAPFPPYAYEDARVVMDRDSAGQPVSPVVVGGVTTYNDGNCTTATGHKVGINGPGNTSNGVATFIDDARWPSVVSLLNHRIVIAYYSPDAHADRRAPVQARWGARVSGTPRPPRSCPARRPQRRRRGDPRGARHRR